MIKKEGSSPPWFCPYFKNSPPGLLNCPFKQSFGLKHQNLPKFLTFSISMTRLVFLVSTLGLHCTLSLQAQITFSGQINPLPPTPKAALEAWQLDHWQQIAEFPLQPDGSFSQVLNKPKAGQYRLRAWSQTDKWVDFILPDSLPVTLNMRLEVNYESMDGQSVRISELPENDLYVDLMNARQRMLLRRDSLGAQTNNDLASFNRLCREVIAQHRNTMAADVAALLVEPTPADHPTKPALAKLTANEFAKAHALEGIPFHHNHVLAHNLFVKSLNRYFKYFDRDTAGNIAFIQGVMSRRNGNDAVDGYLFKYLLDKMIDYRQEGGLTYLLSWYAPDCTDEHPLPSSLRLLLLGLKNCVPGKISADLALPGLDGQPVKLSEVCAQHPLTLMLFWRSTCSHCREFEPELVKIYEKYHPLGLEVYALSNDRTEQEWKDFLQENPMPWINVYIPPEQRATVAQFFPAPSTPTLISLDKQHRVVSRLISRSTLETYIETEMPKHK